MGQFKNNKQNNKRAGKFTGKSRAQSMHKATCTQCNQPCEVPFKPSPSKPVLCNNCFKKEGSFDTKRFENTRQNNRSDKGFRSNEKKMYTATCADCGNRCEVPFRPSGDKPVYCSNCFDGGSKKSNASNENIEALNQKLDEMSEKLDKALKILSILKPQKRIFTVDQSEVEAIQTENKSEETNDEKEPTTKKVTTKKKAISKKKTTTKKKAKK